MIDIARHKLSNHAETEFITGDFSRTEFKGKFDVVVSSLALHHLKTDNDKKSFYNKIYGLLNKSGVFMNADVVLASTEYLQELNMFKWVEYMKTNVSEKEVFDSWIPKYKSEDKPSILLEQLRWIILDLSLLM